MNFCVEVPVGAELGSLFILQESAVARHSSLTYRAQRCASPDLPAKKAIVVWEWRAWMSYNSEIKQFAKLSFKEKWIIEHEI